LGKYLIKSFTIPFIILAKLAHHIKPQKSYQPSNFSQLPHRSRQHQNLLQLKNLFSEKREKTKDGEDAKP
jgi:hypothetical protein